MFRLTGGGGSSLRSSPSIPAAQIAANARYGLQEGSGMRSSARVLFPRRAGTRIMALLFDTDHAMFVGASYPGVRRLYEFTVGFVMATNAEACSRTPAIQCSMSSESWCLPFSSKNAFLPSLKTLMWQCMPEPLMPFTGLGMNVACKPLFMAMRLTTVLNVRM